MAAVSKFNILALDCLTAVHDFSSDTFKLLLSLVAPVVGDETKADLTEIAAGGGYSAGGLTLTVSVAQVGATARVTIDDIILTASGTIADWRYATIYNDSSAGDSLIGWIDTGQTRSLGTGETFTFDFDDALGAGTLS